eukprot:CAMPEP_0119009060 /NCGR_PEP_ID=MMETSP1176-20130426/4118_1 /TAXON_ID=265551 /ORGANISM="Synedropsis recta cf, Strain CCMP1620" /LENGTH=414 /DNA_ID=CAMNT_0006961505 /DNA_START=92 /DNA_END=1333 /DNA_ORIENTATION=+
MVSDSRVGPLLNRLGGLYRDPNRVDRDASSLLKSSLGKHLSPNLASLVENNGDSANTLCLKGTISIHFRGTEYQQLMDLHLPPGYPVRPPVAYVRLAAPNMYLKENHPHVGHDGQVYLPYLHEWRPRSHTLIELVVAMSSVFSADPPVFTRAASAANPAAAMVSPPPPPSNSYSSSYSATSASMTTANDDSMSERDAIAQVQEQIALDESKLEAEQVAQALKEEQQRAAQETWDAKNFASTKEKVRRKLQSHLQKQQQTIQQQVQTDMMDAKRLQLSQDRLEGQLESMTVAKQQLEDQHGVVDKALVDIRALVETTKQEQQEQQSKDGEQKQNIDDLVRPVSAMDAQLLTLATENASYTDALYFLDKALHHRTITVTIHLKAVRQLAKQQFLARAVLVKIAQLQMSSQNGRTAK